MLQFRNGWTHLSAPGAVANGSFLGGQLAAFVVLLYKLPSARLSNYFHRAESVLVPADSTPVRAVAALLMLSRLFVLYFVL